MDRSAHPLISSLGEAGKLSPYFDMPVVDSRTEEWTRARDLFLGDAASLRNLVLAYGREAWGSHNNHVAGSAFIIAYLTRVVYPVIGQYVLHRRVPCVTLENLSFHRADGRIDATGLNRPSFYALPGDPHAGHPEARIASDECALYRRLKDQLFTTNAAVVIKALHRSAGASIKVSQNAVAAACAQALHRLYPLAPDPSRVVEVARTLFEDSSSLVFRQVSMEVVEHGGKKGFFARRAGCCLVWRTERARGYCSNCILTPQAQQTREFQEMLRGEELPIGSSALP